MSRLLVFVPTLLTGLFSAMFVTLGGMVGTVIGVVAAVLTLVMLVAVHRHFLILTRKGGNEL